MKKLHFIWIDDRSEREKVSNTLKDSIDIDIDITFINVQGNPVDQALAELVEKNEPDLVILDHSLDQAISQTYRTGSTAAAFLHEKWQKCPIVSCTGMNIDEVDIRDKSAYEAMFPVNHISDYYETIKAIAVGFKFLKGNSFSNPKELVDTLQTPENDKDKMIKILHRDFKENLDDPSIISEWYRWCESVLFARPGFLYDQKWAALLLGLTEQGFNTVKDQFVCAKYSGVFSTESFPRWWKSELVRVLSEITGEVGISWELGRKLVTNDSYYSICYYSSEMYPETIAALDSSNKTSWEPMKLKYTDSHPNYEDMLFFEELRIMSTDD